MIKTVLKQSALTYKLSNKHGWHIPCSCRWYKLLFIESVRFVANYVFSQKISLPLILFHMKALFKKHNLHLKEFKTFNQILKYTKFC